MQGWRKGVLFVCVQGGGGKGYCLCMQEVEERVLFICLHACWGVEEKAEEKGLFVCVEGGGGKGSVCMHAGGHCVQTVHACVQTVHARVQTVHARVQTVHACVQTVHACARGG